MASAMATVGYPEHNGTTYIMDPLPGYTFDPTSRTGRALKMIVVTSVLFPIATLALGIRLFTRLVLERKFCLDDGFMTAAWIFNTVHLSFSFAMLGCGLSKHMWNVSVAEFAPDFLLFDIVGQGFFWLAAGFAKCSILLFYLNMFPVRGLHIAVWVAFTFTIGYTVAGFLAGIFSCRPVAAAWNLELLANSWCINQTNFYLSQAGLGIVTDVTTFLIPLPLLRSLRLPLRQKIAVAFVLSVGASVCVIGAYRLRSVIEFGNAIDFTEVVTDMMMWCIIETQLSIIGGCAPTYKTFLRRVSPKLLGSSKDSDEPKAQIYLNSRRVRNPVTYPELRSGLSGNYKGGLTSGDRDHPTASEEHIRISDLGGQESGSEARKTPVSEYEVEGGTTDEEDGTAKRPAAV